MQNLSLKVSIVTVCFNLIKNGRRDSFIKALDSVASQDYENVEHIIIDGASKDGTLELIKSCAEKYKIKYISEPDSGIYDAMNKGIRNSSGDVIAFLNSDDFYHLPTAVSSVVKVLSESDAAYAYSGIRVFYEAENRYEIHFAKMYNIFKSIPFCHQAMFTRRSAFEKYGNFDTSLKMSADYDFMLRLALAGEDAVLVDDVFATFKAGYSIDLSALIERNTLRIMLKNYGAMLGKPEKYAVAFWNYRFPLKLYSKIYSKIHLNMRGFFYAFVQRQLIREMFVIKKRAFRRTIRFFGFTIVMSRPPDCSK